MSYTSEVLVVTTDSVGAGTAHTTRPISGEVVSIRLDGTALNGGGTTDFTFTRINDNGTVLALTDASAPWQYQPTEPTHSTTGGTTAYALGTGPVYGRGVACDSHVKLVVAEGAASASGTVVIYYRR